VVGFDACLTRYRLGLLEVGFNGLSSTKKHFSAKHQDILAILFEFSTGDTFGRASRDLESETRSVERLKAVRRKMDL
jgi:hypothetical protein